MYADGSALFAQSDSTTTPDRLYHVSSPENREAILADGLCTRFDRTGFGAVFLSNSAFAASADVWEVDARGLALERDVTTDPPEDGSLGSSWWMSFTDIPATRLVLRVPHLARERVISFRDALRGAHHGQKDLSLYLDIDGQNVGRVDYVLLHGTPHVEYIDVPVQRRQGHASRLMRELQRRHEGVEIHWGMLTEDGAALYRALPKRIVLRQEVVELQHLLTELKQRRDALLDRCEHFFALEQPTDAQRLEFTQAITPLNSLHDAIFELERDLADQRVETVLIEPQGVMSGAPPTPEIEP